MAGGRALKLAQAASLEILSEERAQRLIIAGEATTAAAHLIPMGFQFIARLEKATRRAWRQLHRQHMLNLRLAELMARRLLMRHDELLVFMYERELLVGPEWATLEGSIRNLIEAEWLESLRGAVLKWHNAFYTRTGKQGSRLKAEHTSTHDSGAASDAYPPLRLSFGSPAGRSGSKGVKEATSLNHSAHHRPTCALGQEICRQDVQLSLAPHSPCETVGQHRPQPYYTSYFPQGSTEHAHLHVTSPLRISSTSSKLLNSKVLFVHHHPRRDSEPEDERRVQASPGGEGRTPDTKKLSSELDSNERQRDERAKRLIDARRHYSQLNRQRACTSITATEKHEESIEPIFVVDHHNSLYECYVHPLVLLPKTHRESQGPDVNSDSFGAWVRCIAEATRRRHIRYKKTQNQVVLADLERSGNFGSSSCANEPPLNQSLNLWELIITPAGTSSDLALKGPNLAPHSSSAATVGSSGSNRPSLQQVLAALYLTADTSLAGGEVILGELLPRLTDDALFWKLVSLWQAREPHVFEVRGSAKRLSSSGLDRRRSAISPSPSNRQSPMNASLSIGGSSNHVLISDQQPQQQQQMTASQTKLSHPAGLACRQRIDQIAALAVTERLQIEFPKIPLRVRGMFVSTLVQTPKDLAELTAAADDEAETSSIVMRLAKNEERRVLLKHLAFLPALVGVPYPHRAPTYDVQIPIEDLDLLEDPGMLELIKEFTVATATSTAPPNSLADIAAFTTGEMLLSGSQTEKTIASHEESSLATPAAQHALSSSALAAIVNPSGATMGTIVAEDLDCPSSTRSNLPRASLLSGGPSAAWFPRRYSMFGSVPAATASTAEGGLEWSRRASTRGSVIALSGADLRRTFSAVEALTQRIVAYVNRAALLHRRRQLMSALDGLGEAFSVPIEMFEPYIAAEDKSICALLRDLAIELRSRHRSSGSSANSPTHAEAVSIKERVLLAAHHALPQIAEDFFSVSDLLLARGTGNSVAVHVASPPQNKRALQSANATPHGGSFLAHRTQSSSVLWRTTKAETASAAEDLASSPSGTTGAIGAAVRLAFADSAVQLAVARFASALLERGNDTAGCVGAFVGGWGSQQDDDELFSLAQRVRRAIAQSSVGSSQ